jgi:4-alpha-glucanotransferase
LLEKAWRKFSAGARTDLRPLFERFGQDQAHWLDDYALFRALKVVAARLDSGFGAVPSAGDAAG